MDAFIALLAAAFPLMGSPGPVTLASAAAGAVFPPRYASGYVVAMTAGTLTVITLVAVGLTGILLSVPGLAPILGVLAGLYIIWLAWRIATAPPLAATDEDALPPSRWGGYAMAVMNPKAYVAFLALFSGYPILPEHQIIGIAVKIVLLAGFALTVNLAWMVLGRTIAGLMRSPKASQRLNMTFAVLLLLSVAISFYSALSDS